MSYSQENVPGSSTKQSVHTRPFLKKRISTNFKTMILQTISNIDSNNLSNDQQFFNNDDFLLFIGTYLCSEHNSYNYARIDNEDRKQYIDRIMPQIERDSLILSRKGKTLHRLMRDRDLLGVAQRFDEITIDHIPLLLSLNHYSLKDTDDTATFGSFLDYILRFYWRDPNHVRNTQKICDIMTWTRQCHLYLDARIMKNEYGDNILDVLSKMPELSELHYQVQEIFARIDNNQLVIQQPIHDIIHTPTTMLHLITQGILGAWYSDYQTSKQNYPKLIKVFINNTLDAFGIENNKIVSLFNDINQKLSIKVINKQNQYNTVEITTKELLKACLFMLVKGGIASDKATITLLSRHLLKLCDGFYYPYDYSKAKDLHPSDSNNRNHDLYYYLVSLMVKIMCGHHMGLCTDYYVRNVIKNQLEQYIKESTESFIKQCRRDFLNNQDKSSYEELQDYYLVFSSWYQYGYDDDIESRLWKPQEIDAQEYYLPKIYDLIQKSVLKNIVGIDPNSSATEPKFYDGKLIISEGTFLPEYFDKIKDEIRSQVLRLFRSVCGELEVRQFCVQIYDYFKEREEALANHNSIISDKSIAREYHAKNHNRLFILPVIGMLSHPRLIKKALKRDLIYLSDYIILCNKILSVSDYIFKMTIDDHFKGPTDINILNHRSTITEHDQYYMWRLLKNKSESSQVNNFGDKKRKDIINKFLSKDTIDILNYINQQDKDISQATAKLFIRNLNNKFTCQISDNDLQTLSLIEYLDKQSMVDDFIQTVQGLNDNNSSLTLVKKLTQRCSLTDQELNFTDHRAFI